MPMPIKSIHLGGTRAIDQLVSQTRLQHLRHLQTDGLALEVWTLTGKMMRSVRRHLIAMILLLLGAHGVWKTLVILPMKRPLVRSFHVEVCDLS
jgi:hypothetical protein